MGPKELIVEMKTVPTNPYESIANNRAIKVRHIG